MLEIYTDGACRNNGRADARGGWGVFIPSLGVGYSGGEFGTTNNRMEMMACARAMRIALAEGYSSVKILTDSKYVVDGLTSWMHGWKRKGNFQPGLKNFDLWKELDELFAELRPELKWVRGHNGNAGNERADELSVFGIDHPEQQSHAGVELNRPFGKSDKTFSKPEPTSVDLPDSTQVVQGDEDLTSLFDEFEEKSVQALNETQPAEECHAWEGEVTSLIARLSRLAELQLETNQKKALQTLKLLTTLATKAQESTSTTAKLDEKSLKKQKLALEKAISKSQTHLEKPTIKKILGN